MVILLTSKISPSSIMQCYSCFRSCFDFSCQINFVYKYIPLRGSGLYKPLFSFGFPCHFFFIKVKVTLFNVGSSFSPYGTAINGSRRCALYPPCHCQCSVLRGFKAIATRTRGKSKQTLKSLKIEPGTSRSESRALAN